MKLRGSSPTRGVKPLYFGYKLRKISFILSVFLLLLALILLSLSFGAASMGLKGVLEAFLGRGDAVNRAIIWRMRMPRAAMAVLGGAGLGLSGAAIQGVLRNPLASPFTLGVASASGFGAALAITMGAGLLGWGRYLVAFNAFTFALLATVIAYGVARIKGASSTSLILAGIAVMYLFSSLTSILQYIGRREEVHAVVFWLMGSLNGVRWNEVCFVGAAVVMSLPILILKSWDMNIMLEGDEVALSLGVNVRCLRLISIALSSLMTASLICFTGTIGFIGLMAPHIVRLAIGAEHSLLFPASALTGSLLLLTADTASRLILSPSEIPIGITTSLIGVPFFLYLLIRRGR
ncbi:MAG TPA: iron ABC transporter permease [Candidatus Latescibacteria bacterium]|nr:iron ABC transporter permease [Candidatus Latescibacterota bacterium]